MYEDERLSYEEYLEQKRAYVKRKKKKKLKRFFAVIRIILIFAFLLCILGAAIFGAYKLISKLVGSKGIFSESEYVADVGTIPLEEIDNVFETADDDIYSDSNNSDSGTKNDGSINIPDHVNSGLIVIDAGHGGQDSGAFNDNSFEKDINLSIAIMVKHRLEDKGFTVYMTREDDTYVGLSMRAKLANDLGNALAFVSIHQNSLDEGESADDVDGVEALTYKRSGCGELAELLLFHVSEAVGARNRGVQYKTNLVVTSKTTMPAVIIECGFMSNPEEAGLLATEDYQAKLSVGISNALEEFINTYY